MTDKRQLAGLLGESVEKLPQMIGFSRMRFVLSEAQLASGSGSDSG